jgi:hypothetical protein
MDFKESAHKEEQSPCIGNLKRMLATPLDDDREEEDEDDKDSKYAVDDLKPEGWLGSGSFKYIRFRFLWTLAASSLSAKRYTRS